MSEPIKDKSILLVEDDELVASSVEDILLYAQAGHVHIASSIGLALQAIQDRTFDVAVVDINLNGQASWPVAEELARRHIPYLTVSGYSDMMENQLTGPLLPKPYSMKQLLDAVGALL